MSAHFNRQRNPGQLPSQSRARVACQYCHSRKIRCNAADRTPCSNCASNATDCVLIKSQRGRYPRNRRRAQQQDPSTQQESPLSGTVDKSLRHEPAEGRGALKTATTTSARPAFLDNLSPSRANAQDAFSSLSSPAGAHSSASTPTRDNTSPDMLYANIAETSVSTGANLNPQDVDYVFLGETFSLTYVVNDVLAPFFSKTPRYQKHLHFPLSRAGSQPPDSRSCPDPNVVQQTLLLKERAICYRPSPDILQQLLDAYFSSFHYAFPLVDQSKFMKSSDAICHSQLVLNAILMIATTVCEDSLLQAADLESRHMARASFYDQARCLYDADAEPEKLNNITALFLISFWWGGPNDVKDSWHWLGTAVTIAKSAGLHRTTKSSHVARKRAQTWKRIWWSLKIRDALISASIGRPQHIWQGDCDVEVPTFEDVEDNLVDGTSEDRSYFIQMAQLSIIVSRIIESRYGCSSSRTALDDRDSLERALVCFKETVPTQLRYHGVDESSGRGLWAAMLSMAYDYAMILLSRPACALNGQEQLQRWGNRQKSVSAANSIARTIEDLLSASVTRLCQVHAIAALFNALAVHVYMICTSRTIDRSLAKTRAKVCMLGLAAMQDSWPVGGWVLKLFEMIMHRLRNSTNGESSKGEKQSHILVKPSSQALGAFDANNPPVPTNGSAPQQSGHLDTQELSKAAAQQGLHVSFSPFGQGDTQDLFSASTYQFPDLGYDIPNMFFVNDNVADAVFNEENFYQSLDIPNFHHTASR